MEAMVMFCQSVQYSVSALSSASTRPRKISRWRRLGTSSMAARRSLSWSTVSEAGSETAWVCDSSVLTLRVMGASRDGVGEESSAIGRTRCLLGSWGRDKEKKMNNQRREGWVRGRGEGKTRRSERRGSASSAEKSITAGRGREARLDE